MALDQNTMDRIAREFPVGQSDVVEALSGYSGPESARVVRDILELSKGSLAKIKQYVEAARMDYRDILYWAEYYENDPFLRGRNPKQIVDEILTRFGKPE